MAQKLNITVSDKVFAEIETKRSKNRSEFVEELIRIGLNHYPNIPSSVGGGSSK
jgi:hypothetical protein